jgi:pyruvate/2-oxoglutarate dehydrogenase complex dihydrolipoamide dehydrogenase (E3) component
MAELITPDICVVGGGPAGIALALGAARRGVPVVLIEKDQMGGANLTSGAIPSKALAAAASHYDVLRRAPAFGVSGAPLQVNLSKVGDHIRSVGEAVAPQLSAERLTALGVRVINAPARFLDRRTLIADEHTVIARRFVIATGALPRVPEIPGLDDVDYMVPETAFDISRKPSHLIVIGAGAYALELSQSFNRLGVDATVIDTERALPDEDPEHTAVVLDRLRAEGIRIRDGIEVSGVARRRGGIRVTVVEDGEEIAVDGSHLLVAAGRVPNVADIGLEAAGIACDNNGVTVDRQLRTTNRRVYAIGDVVGGPAAAMRGERQAECILRSILYRLPIRYDQTDIPIVTFTDPALARVGISEAEARRQDLKIRVLRFPFVENHLAQAERMLSGFIKVIVTPRGRLLGATIVGHNAGELIALWSLAIANRLDIQAIAELDAPYPSRSAISKSVAETFGDDGLTPNLRRRIIEFLRKFG